MIHHRFFKKWLVINVIILFFTTGFSVVISAHNEMMTPKTIFISQPKELPQHQLLLTFVKFLYEFRNFRANILIQLSSVTMRWNQHLPIHPLLFLRGELLQLSAYVWLKFWLDLSDKMGWGWGEILPY
jgi:hypothetical protein